MIPDYGRIRFSCWRYGGEDFLADPFRLAFGIHAIVDAFGGLLTIMSTPHEQQT
ncbi:hypothetical protein JOC55_003733 [Paenibacillus sacheonensis]|nr:hypothetical protein [Paenibacillus sacheonensis]